MVRHVPIVNVKSTIVRWLGAATDVQDQHLALDAVEPQVENRTRERDSLCRRLLAADEGRADRWLASCTINWANK
jgi:hypothetical protein